MKINNSNDPKLFLNLIDACNALICKLRILGLESNSLNDLVFINFIVSKLNPVVRQRWELSIEEEDQIPGLDMLR